MKPYANLHKSEIEVFRKIGHQFLDGELTVPEFKGKSGGMGVYAQKGGKTFMIRLKTPSGTITREHMNLILSYVEKYRLNRVHLTTRQAVQLHDLSLDDACDIMEDALDHSLFTRGGGGNYPRNVSLSPLSGVERGEAFDVTPYALLVGEYFTSNASGYHLPRKLKVAFSNSIKDTACATINDLGFVAVKKDGEAFFEVYLAGGLGGGAALSLKYDKLIPPEEVLYYVEATIRLFMDKGNYENKAKARLRFVPREMGEEEFFKCFEQHLAAVKETVHFEEIVPVLSEEDWTPELTDYRNVLPQKQKNRYTLILHPECGQMSPKEFKEVVQFMNDNKEENIEIRLSMEEDMYIRNLTKDMVQNLYETFLEMAMKSKVEMSVSCVGVPTCQIGILQSQKLCREIIAAIKFAGLKENLLPRIHISGCPNSCSRHQVSHLGFAGRRQKVDGTLNDVFEVYVGGEVGNNNTKMGERLGAMRVSWIPEYVVQLAKSLEEKELCFEKYIEMERNHFVNLTETYLIP